MKASKLGVVVMAFGLAACAAGSQTAKAPNANRPDPNEIPLPRIRTSMPEMPGVNQLPDRTELPDVMRFADGKPVKTLQQWSERREEMKRILTYYAVGQAPPPPGNVKGVIVSSQVLLGGKVKYLLVHLTFGPHRNLSLDIGIFTPAQGGPFPVVISPSGTPPGATPLPHLPQGANQGRGQDVLLAVGPAPQSQSESRAARQMLGLVPRTAEQIAENNPALAHGFAFVTFNYTDCGEDTTLRLPDGSWAYRTTRFFPAYPHYDWGLLRAWAWGASRIADYLVTDPAIDKDKLIITGVSRTGKAALIAGAFDERFAMVAPVASSGGGTPAYRFSGSIPDRGGKEGLTEMVRKYPNWFSPHLHQFWGQPDKLPFDENFLLALVAPRPLICLEGDHDQNVNQNGVYQSFIAAKPAYEFLHAADRLGVNWADRPHGMVQDDWDALLAFADKFLLGKTVERQFDQFSAAVSIQETIWRFDNIHSIDGLPTHVLGHPQVIDSPYGKAIAFNGVDEALFVDKHPLAGASTYTWDVIFRPDADGAPAQRFFHLSEIDPTTGKDTDNRMLFEIRIVKGEWCLDSYANSNGAERALLNCNKLYPLGQWYRVTAVYDGKTLRNYVGNELQGEGELHLTPQGPGHSSIGTRINKIDFFKGAIFEARMTPRALPPEEFLKMPPVIGSAQNK